MVTPGSADGDLERAAALGRDAIRPASQVSSHLTLERLRTLQRQVQPLTTRSSQLSDPDERLTTLLSRSAPTDQQA